VCYFLSIWISGYDVPDLTKFQSISATDYPHLIRLHARDRKEVVALVPFKTPSEGPTLVSRRVAAALQPPPLNYELLVHAFFPDIRRYLDENL
jgi:hypothetical protein